MSTYSIKDLEQLSGIKAHTLRIWEQRYNIINPKRTKTNIRYYDDDDLRLLLNISLLNEHGYKISKIAQMTPEHMHQKVLSITEKSGNFQDQVQALTISMFELDEDRFEKLMSTNILHHGFEKTMMHVVYPFLFKIGVMWQTGAINPAHEHFITYLIRQKIIVAIDGLVLRQHEHQRKFFLYLPEGELHELSLLFANYLIRSRHHRVVYLGQSLPQHDLREAYKVHRPDYFFSILTAVPGPQEIEPYLARLGDDFPHTQILLTGYQVVGQDLRLPPNVQVFNQIEDLVRFLDEAAPVVNGHGVNLGHTHFS